MASASRSRARSSPFETGYSSTFANGALTIETTALLPNTPYLIDAGDSSAGPFVTVLDA